MNITFALDLREKDCEHLLDLNSLLPSSSCSFCCFFMCLSFLLLLFSHYNLFIFLFFLYLFTRKITQFQLQCCGRSDQFHIYLTNLQFFSLLFFSLSPYLFIGGWNCETHIEWTDLRLKHNFRFCKFIIFLF
jgi:hypothetical protein